MKMNSNHWLLTGAIAYLFVAVLTFGHAFNGMREKSIELVSYGSLLCAAAWPLYWSVKLFEPKELK